MGSFEILEFEGQHLLTVRTGTVSGKPARNMAMRASLAR